MAYTLRNFPAEIRDMIFCDVRGEDLKGQNDLLQVAVAVCGDKELLGEVMSVLYKSAHIVISPGPPSDQWLHQQVPLAIMEKIKILEFRFGSGHKSRHRRVKVSEPNPSRKFPKILILSKEVKHIHLNIQDRPITHHSIYKLLNEWASRFGGVQKLSVAFSGRRTQLTTLQMLDLALGVCGVIGRANDGSTMVTWIAAIDSILVLGQFRPWLPSDGLSPAYQALKLQPATDPLKQFNPLKTSKLRLYCETIAISELDLPHILVDSARLRQIIMATGPAMRPGLNLDGDMMTMVLHDPSPLTSISNTPEAPDVIIIENSDLNGVHLQIHKAVLRDCKLHNVRMHNSYLVD
ncbi:hypothetical protein VTL71DRAFT_8609 [Oculimacula yallundae]|uniref:BTB domain-containing protein n=1 Tax=Oculimacula yallundae TaxID=86028 RepID=A0ABR4CY28_9HELO